MADMPEPLQAAIKNLNAAIALVDEQSHDTYYAAFWTTVAHLQGQVNNIIENFRPGIEVRGSLRLPPKEDP